ncbi:class I SAM-dependent methyltransferase [Bdellovibrio sp. KM01]|uniref:class I SAM-dependent methyltransferase n=1 Tax=Bdellovibrio sp. KM01 TaxID=2748865 RepID=UPI0015EB0783|nr:class I SAM-dependent methyltransferase [Bdellovibrio sp. KM01]QLY24437.1 class I SAM-dependent methyltransferase [Bdellovibrio sp. KM01]
MTRTIKLRYTETTGCIFVDKIAGLNTHTPEHGQRGCVEVYEEELDRKLFVVHRLDKATSGALCFAKSSEDAAEISRLFEQHLVSKKYLFLTDKPAGSLEFTYQSHIEKEKNKFVSTKDKEPNSKTTFRWIKALGRFQLWEAIPHTGKPHQIRLHAEAKGIPILGDSEHGGSRFYRLCLHSHSLEFTLRGEPIKFETDLPVWAKDGELNEHEEDLILAEAFQRRERLYKFTELKDESLRLSHRELDTYRIDQYGEYLWVYWYKEEDPSVPDLLRFERISKKLKKKILIRKMLNRGDDPNAELLWTIGQTQTSWVAKENNVKYELRSDTGLSPGLFLDQRENRLWVSEHAQDRRVLNLFSYTSGFSVVSAMAGAQEVCTVDVSANFLDWSKRNFVLNGLDPEHEKYEFWNSDCILFLKGTVRRKRKFGLIICDPPSFGRSKNGVFSISKNFDELMINAMYCLEKNGLLLFCTNYEKWTSGDLHLRLEKLKREFSFKILPAPSQGIDFELPDQEPLMKSIILRKN